MTVHNLTLIWQDIIIDITHDDCWSDFPELDHYLQHIEIKRRDLGELPISETGYLSKFMFGKNPIKPYGSVIKLVEKMLNEAEESKEWKAYIACQNQMILF